jgi:hypothetical protein
MFRPVPGVPKSGSARIPGGLTNSSPKPPEDWALDAVRAGVGQVGGICRHPQPDHGRCLARAIGPAAANPQHTRREKATGLGCLVTAGLRPDRQVGERIVRPLGRRRSPGRYPERPTYLGSRLLAGTAQPESSVVADRPGLSARSATHLNHFAKPLYLVAALVGYSSHHPMEVFVLRIRLDRLADDSFFSLLGRADDGLVGRPIIYGGGGPPSILPPFEVAAQVWWLDGSPNNHLANHPTICGDHSFGACIIDEPPFSV